MEEIFLSHSLKDTQKFAKKLSKKLLNYKLVLFDAPMGSGKTTFILDILKAFHVKTIAGSPTFTLVNEYHLKNKTILHYDLYRISEAKELINLDFSENIEKADLVFIEWPDIAQKFLSLKNTLTIKIEKLDSSVRRFVLKD